MSNIYICDKDVEAVVSMFTDCFMYPDLDRYLCKIVISEDSSCILNVEAFYYKIVDGLIERGFLCVPYDWRSGRLLFQKAAKKGYFVEMFSGVAKLGGKNVEPVVDRLSDLNRNQLSTKRGTLGNLALNSLLKNLWVYNKNLVILASDEPIAACTDSAIVQSVVRSDCIKDRHSCRYVSTLVTDNAVVIRVTP